ncbi:hypothetical protein MRX96_004646 [Rhipicephalus microplus]
MEKEEPDKLRVSPEGQVEEQLTDAENVHKPAASRQEGVTGRMQKNRRVQKESTSAPAVLYQGRDTLCDDSEVETEALYVMPERELPRSGAERTPLMWNLLLRRRWRPALNALSRTVWWSVKP